MHRAIVVLPLCLFAVVAALGCSSSASDAAPASAEPVSAEAAAEVCEAPKGETCPPTAGNCKGIGAPCTKGGGECGAFNAMCDVDFDPRGVGVCITVLTCTPGSCGTGATCCKSASTQNTPVCMANQCLPADCSPDAT